MLNVIEKKPSQKTATESLQPRISVSRQMYERFERRKLWRRFLTAIYISTYGVYLTWCFTIIDPDFPLVSGAFFAAQCIGFVLSLMYVTTNWQYHYRKPLPCPQGLSVDVFVTTYKEPLHIIRRTAMAAKGLTYPHSTVILDDGRREEVRALAAELGIRYLSRPDNKNAKAGNLNFGFAQTVGDFVMSLDADHIVMPHALDLMLGFFADEKVALVQAPQDFYNTDAIQYMSTHRKNALWHDQLTFYSVTEPCGDNVNAVTCIGTGVVYRRSSIAGIGGIPTETVTEDIYTSLRLQKNGYRVAYINEPIAYGLAEDTFPEFCKVRHRWAHGNIHAVARENVFFCKGFSWRQRIQYATMMLMYLEGWQQVIQFLVPVTALFFGRQPFQMSIFNILVVMIYPVIAAVVAMEASGGFFPFWASQILAMMRWPIHIVSFSVLFGRKVPFHASMKNADRRIPWKLMMPQISVMALSLSAVTFGVFRLCHHWQPGALFGFLSDLIMTGHMRRMDLHEKLPPSYTSDLVAVAGFWSLYTVLRGAAMVRKVIVDTEKLHNFFRFHIPIPLSFGSQKGYGCVSDISEEWIRFRDYRSTPHEIPKGILDVTLALPAGPLPVRVRVERVQGGIVEGALLFDSERQRDMLANALYSCDWHREILNRNAYFPTPSDYLLRALRLPTGIPDEHRQWQGVLFSSAEEPASASENYGLLSKTDVRGDMASFITFKDLSDNDEVTGIVFEQGDRRLFRALVVGRESLASLTPKGLDGARTSRYRIRLVA